MIRTDRKTVEDKGDRGKNFGVEIEPYTDKQIADIAAAVAEAAERRRGPTPRYWEDVEEGDELGPLVKGPLRVTDIVVWHAGVGMGLYGVKSLRQHAAAMTSTTSRVHGIPMGVGRADLRLRPVADPSLHRLDGRRRLALEARLRVPSKRGDTHWMRTSPGAKDRRSTSKSGVKTNGAKQRARAMPPCCCRANTVPFGSPNHRMVPQPVRRRSTLDTARNGGGHLHARCRLRVRRHRAR